MISFTILMFALVLFSIFLAGSVIGTWFTLSYMEKVSADVRAKDES